MILYVQALNPIDSSLFSFWPSKKREGGGEGTSNYQTLILYFETKIAQAQMVQILVPCENYIVISSRISSLQYSTDRNFPIVVQPQHERCQQ